MSRMCRVCYEVFNPKYANHVVCEHCFETSPEAACRETFEFLQAQYEERLDKKQDDMVDNLTPHKGE